MIRVKAADDSPTRGEEPMVKKSLSGFILCIILVTLLVAAGNTAVPRASDDVGSKDWELPAAHLRDNGYRGEVVLNGFWAERPIGGSGSFVKARVPDGNPGFEDENERKDTREFYREFFLPKGWESRRVVLETGGFLQEGQVTLDGKPIAQVPKRARFFEMDLPVGGRREEAYRLGITTTSITGDTWLRSFPKAGAVIEDSFLTTSYRQREVRIRLAGAAPGGAQLRVTARIYSDPKGEHLVKTFASDQPVPTDATGHWQADLSASWPDAKLWSRWHPNLYYYTVDLASESGEITDKMLPRSFGFREVWLSGGQLYLNGIPINATSDSWPAALGGGNVMPEQAEAVVANAKKVGFTWAWHDPLEGDAFFDITDRQGMLVMRSAGGLMKEEDYFNPDVPEADAEARAADIARVVRHWREHPSLVLWWSDAPYSTGDTLYSRLVGKVSDSWNYFPENANPEKSLRAHLIFKRAADLISSLDPTRPVMTQGGPYTEVEGATRYLCYNLDLQEREEFFDYWARSGRPKALWITEFGVPFQSFYFIRKFAHQLPDSGKNLPTIYVEAAARLFGDQVYLDVPDDTLKQWPQTQYMTNLDHIPSPVFQRLVAEQVAAIWRAWRTYGVSAASHYVFVDGFMPIQNQPPVPRYHLSDNIDPRRPGYSRVVAPRNAHASPMLGIDKMLPAGKAYLDNVSPLLAYIGGPDGHFTSKDHLYYAGAPVRKAAIVLNDYDDPAMVDGQWQLLDAAGKAVLSGPIKGTVEAGKRAVTDFPIQFAAPAVTERTDYTLTIKLTANLPGTLEDRFAITVFPPHKPKPLSFAGKIWRLNASYDRTDDHKHSEWNKETEQFLQAIGVQSQLVPGLKQFGATATPEPGDLLIIPRRYLESGSDGPQFNARLLEEMNIDQLVERGLRVIVLEQDTPNVFGMNTEDMRPRRVFMAAAGHPIFSGLQPSDLTYWTGDSSLQLAASPITMSANEFPDRIAHVSNTNAVASRTLVRPQVGAVRALAVSGFDLQESPLLEVTRGKGRILFCQMDVSNRYGTDPAATQLVDNMFEYMTAVAAPDPDRSVVAHLPLDGNAVVARRQVFRAAKPAGPDGWGITRGELFFRESIYENNWVTEKLPDVAVPVLASSPQGGLPQVIKRDPATGRYQLTLDETDFKTGWMKRKVAWLRSALIVSQGGSQLEGPAFRYQGNFIKLYPFIWLDDFVDPYQADMV
jgi:beta-galactosidase